jgi:hypothetical protein
MIIEGLAQEYVRLVREIQTEFPAFKIVPKSKSILMRIAGVLLEIITFGKQDRFMTAYTTTLGTTVYVPDLWESRDPVRRIITLRHERVHMRQRARLGALRFLLTYALWILPAGLALGRRNLEQEAYEESLRSYVYYLGVEILDDSEMRANVISHFLGPDYFWMWPFRKSIEAWYDRVVSEIKIERSL